MKVVHLCRVAPPQVGGMEAVIAGLVRAQRAAGIDASVVSLSDAPRGMAVGQALHEGVPVCRLRRRGPRRWPFAVGLVPALRGADLVHVHGVDGLLDQALLTRPLHGARVGLSTHGGYLHTRFAWPVKQLLRRTLTRASLAAVDGLWFTSAADQRRLGRGPGQGRVVSNGLGLDALLALERAPEPGRWLVFGRVAAHKGLDDLVRLLARLPWSVLGPTQVRIVGEVADAAYARRVRLLARRLGVASRLVWVGSVDRAELHEELRRASWALFPSRAEGFGLALVEAMAAGVVPWVRPIDAFTERVVDGESGHHLRLEDPRTPEEVARWVQEDPLAWSEAARAVARRFTWEARLPDYLDAYAAAMAG